MSEEQIYRLSAVKLELLHCATIYSLRALEGMNTDKSEHRLALAAKAFTDTVNAIDPKLWQPDSCNVLG